MDIEKQKAIENGEVHHCPNCNKIQPVELSYFDPNEDTEPTLIVCMVCKEGINFIENL